MRTLPAGGGLSNPDLSTNLMIRAIPHYIFLRGARFVAFNGWVELGPCRVICGERRVAVLERTVFRAVGIAAPAF